MINPTSYKCIHSFEFQNVIYDVFPKTVQTGPQTRDLIKRVETSFMKSIDKMKNADEAVSIRLKSGQIFFIKRSPPLLPPVFDVSLAMDTLINDGNLKYLGSFGNNLDFRNYFCRRLSENPLFDPYRKSLDQKETTTGENIYNQLLHLALRHFKDYSISNNDFKPSSTQLALLTQRHIAFAAVRANPYVLKFIPETHPDYIELALIATCEMEYVIITNPGRELVLTRHQENEFFLRDGSIPKSTSVGKLSHVTVANPGREIVVAAWLQSEGILENIILPTHPDYKEMALSMVKKGYDKLRFVSETHPDYMEIVLAAIEKNFSDFKYVPETHPDYIKITHAAIQKERHVFTEVSKTHPHYKEFALAAVARDWSMFRFVSSEHPDYKEIAIASIQQETYNFSFVPINHEHYEEIALVAIAKCWRSLYDIPKTHPLYKKLGTAAIMKNTEALRYVPKDHEHYEELALLASVKTEQALSSPSPNL